MRPGTYPYVINVYRMNGWMGGWGGWMGGSWESGEGWWEAGMRVEGSGVKVGGWGRRDSSFKGKEYG